MKYLLCFLAILTLYSCSKDPDYTGTHIFYVTQPVSYENKFNPVYAVNGKIIRYRWIQYYNIAPLKIELFNTDQGLKGNFRATVLQKPTWTGSKDDVHESEVPLSDLRIENDTLKFSLKPNQAGVTENVVKGYIIKSDGKVLLAVQDKQTEATNINPFISGNSSGYILYESQTISDLEPIRKNLIEKQYQVLQSKVESENGDKKESLLADMKFFENMLKK